MAFLLNIESYRKCKDYRIELGYGLALIQGPSGSGKTTIIESIRWVLYGNVSHIQDIFSTKRSKVTLECNDNNMIITRTTRPHNLEVTLAKTEQIYNGESAQTLIDELFGNKEIFELSAYLKQDDVPCPMLNVSNNTRLHYITKLCFSDDKSPDIILTAIFDTMKEIDKEYDIMSSQYESNLSEFTILLTDRPVDYDIKINILKWGPENYTNDIKDQINSKIKLREQYERDIAILTQSNKELLNLKEQNESVLNTLKNNIPPEDTDSLKNTLLKLDISINELAAKISSVQNEYNIVKEEHNRVEILEFNHNKLKKEESDIKKELEKIETIHKEENIPNISITSREVYKIEEDTKIYKDNMLQLIKCKHKLLNNSLNAIKTVLDDFNKDLMASKVYRCPKCDSNLCVDVSNHILIPSNISPKEVSPKEVDIKDIEQDILILTRIMNRWVDEPSIKSRHANMILKKTELIQGLKKYSNIDTVQSKINLDELSDKLILLNKSKLDLINQLNTFKHEQNAIQQHINALETEKVKYNTINEQNNKQLKWLAERIDKLLKNENKITEQDIEELNKNINSLNIRLDDAEYAARMLNRHQQLTDMRGKVELKLKDLKDLTALYNNAFNQYYSRLTSVIDRINIALYNKSEDIFSFPLTVSISLEKKMKKSGRIKPIVALDVIYKGQECNPFYHLSYGQRKRLSLLLSIGLNTLTRTPIVLYDEILTNVDLPTREKCIKVIRETVRDNRLVLCAELHGDEREYDNIITLDNDITI